MADLAGLVHDRYRIAAGAHGDLGVRPEDFSAHLARIAARHLGSGIPEPDRVDFIASLHTRDLFLALACALGNDAGWQRLRECYGAFLSDVSRHILGRAPDLQELGETIWMDLFLPDRSGQSRIASYDGRSSLAAWLRVVVSNRVINERQRRSHSAGSIENIPEPADPAALDDVESGLRVGRYRRVILEAFERSLRRLDSREALIVLLRYDQNLPLGQIARLYRVHQSTITRQLERTLEGVRRDVARVLSSDYGLDAEQVRECLTVAAETFSNSVSILALLRDRADAAPAVARPG